jgi:uncharacterized membrane protein
LRNIEILKQNRSWWPKSIQAFHQKVEDQCGFAADQPTQNIQWNIEEVLIVNNGLKIRVDSRLNQARVEATPQAIKQGLKEKLRIVH